jgi:hypothetical protein
MSEVNRQLRRQPQQEARTSEPEVTLIIGRVWSRQAIENLARETGREIVGEG